jgi:hypothetical protein
MKWIVEYDNDTGPYDESFRQWWTVTDGETSFECNSEKKANWLCDLLNSPSTIGEDKWISVLDKYIEKAKGERGYKHKEYYCLSYDYLITEIELIKKELCQKQDKK